MKVLRGLLALLRCVYPVPLAEGLSTPAVERFISSDGGESFCAKSISSKGVLIRGWLVEAAIISNSSESGEEEAEPSLSGAFFKSSCCLAALGRAAEVVCDCCAEGCWPVALT